MKQENFNELNMNKDAKKTAILTCKILTNLFKEEWRIQEEIINEGEDLGQDYWISFGKVVAYTKSIEMISRKFNLDE